jgi:hypothetical protein
MITVDVALTNCRYSGFDRRYVTRVFLDRALVPHEFAPALSLPLDARPGQGSAKPTPSRSAAAHRRNDPRLCVAPVIDDALGFIHNPEACGLVACLIECVLVFPINAWVRATHTMH